MFRRLTLFIATGGGLGYLPLAPGTWGSLGATCLFLAVHLFLPVWTVYMLLVVFFFFSVTAAALACSHFPGKDPGQIVIDEFAGQWLALLPILWFGASGGSASHYYLVLVIQFFLFRFFDIVKPPPINLLQQLPGGWGIALDDWLAGLFSAALFISAEYFL